VSTLKKSQKFQFSTQNFNFFVQILALSVFFDFFVLTLDLNWEIYRMLNKWKFSGQKQQIAEF